MPVSALDPKALARLTPQQIADMVLSLDQERRRCLRRGWVAEAAECQAEIDRLVPVFQRA